MSKQNTFIVKETKTKDFLTLFNLSKENKPTKENCKLYASGQFVKEKQRQINK